MSDDDLMARFDESEESDEDGESKSETSSSDDSSRKSGSDATRDRSQYPMYLSEPLQDRLDDAFKRFNAERTLDGKDEVEKHKHFMEGFVRAGLDELERDVLEDYIMEQLK